MSNHREQLNQEQKRIVERIQGALLVLAPVGTGKTRVLAERVVHAVREGIPARNVLCLTFTNRAAGEMRQRLAQYSPEAARQATIKTFHALCAHILHLHADEAGLPADFVIYDEQDSLGLIKQLFRLSRDRDAQDIFGKINDCKTDYRVPASLGGTWERIFGQLGPERCSYACVYQAVLMQRHALDFGDLIYYVRTLLRENSDVTGYWEHRFQFVQVDEAQDTQMAEYGIVRTLAYRSGNLALIGDLDQTIYRWRGSEPEKVLAQFEADFAPLRSALVKNYRATKLLLQAADSFAASFSKRHTAIEPAECCDPGVRIRLHHAENEGKEAQWIGDQITRLAGGASHFRYDRIAVLTRTNRRCTAVSQGLGQFYPEIPTVTVDQYRFFQRQEIKDALAYVRLLLNPHDTGAVHRVLLRPKRGVGKATVDNIRGQGQTCGLRLTDMVDKRTLMCGDPFAPILESYHRGKAVVFDVETTGLSVGEDEVVELAATRLCCGQPAGTFHAYIKNSVPVGESEQIHGHSDAFLADNGQAGTEVFRHFFDFCGQALLVGHNVGYDIKMVSAHARRLGLTAPVFLFADTWNLASRCVRAEDYRLETLATKLGLQTRPTHRAQDDVQATVELLAALVPKLRQGVALRRSLVHAYCESFQPLASAFEAWRSLTAKLRPAELLARILDESGLLAFYQEETPRRGNLEDLISTFDRHDDRQLHPETALRSVVEFTALARNVDFLAQNDNRVLIATIHQAKGLEFDTVFLAGASDGEIPHFYCQSAADIEGDRHLFYVALTRAKRRLFISGYQQNNWGHERALSPFAADLDPRFVETDGDQAPF